MQRLSILALILALLPLDSAMAEFIFGSFECVCSASKSRLSELSGLEPRKSYSRNEIRRGVERLENLEIFYLVQSAGAGTEADPIRIELKDKWTTIPILKFRSSGEKRKITIGIFDPNAFGSLLEFGGQYEDYSGRDSFVVWHRYPGLFSKKNKLGLEYWNQITPYRLYDPNDYRKLDEKDRTDQRAKMFFEREISRKLTIIPAVEFHELGWEMMPKAGFIRTSLKAQYGFLKKKSWKLSGSLLEVEAGPSFSLRKQHPHEIGAQASFVHLLPLNEKNTLLWALQAKTAVTSSKLYLSRLTLGGFFGVRGLDEEELAGRYLYLLNNELRWAFWESSNLVTQLVPFFDLGQASDRIARRAAVSVGAGARFILPKFYRLVLRLDYAKMLNISERSNWSLGLQQFF